MTRLYLAFKTNGKSGQRLAKEKFSKSYSFFSNFECL